MKPSSHKISTPAVIAVLLALGLFGPYAGRAAVGSGVTNAYADVRQSYRLLSNRFYKPIDPQVLLRAGRTALEHFAHVHHVVVPNEAGRTGIAGLDASIAQVAAAAHVAPSDVAYAAITAMASSVKDRWTEFFTPKEYQAFNDALDPRKISGIGVLMDIDPATKLLRAYFVVPGTPAARAGVRSGDEIVGINGVPTFGMSLVTATSHLRGAAGSVAHVTLRRDGKTLAPIAIVRSDIRPPTVVYKMLPDRIGYIFVAAFGKTTPQEFDVALARLRTEHARALVLDLRNDGGGYVDSALTILSRFISRKMLMEYQERGKGMVAIDADPGPVVHLPMVVLVNSYTASAAEITSGALQDDGIAMLVGTKTFGKGVMQTLTPLPGGSAIKITTARYRTPNGQDINLRGIEPNVHVKENKDARFANVMHDAQLRAAFDLLQKKIASR